MSTMRDRASGQRKGFEARHVRKHNVRAFGAVAFATLYSVPRPSGPAMPRRAWLLEWMHPRHGWLTADPDTMRDMDIEGARKFVEASNGEYRLVIRMARGYVPDKVKDRAVVSGNKSDSVGVGERKKREWIPPELRGHGTFKDR